MDRQPQRRPARPLVELRRLRNARQLQRRWQTGRIGDLPRDIIWRIWDEVEAMLEAAAYRARRRLYLWLIRNRKVKASEQRFWTLNAYTNWFHYRLNSGIFGNAFVMGRALDVDYEVTRLIETRPTMKDLLVGLRWRHVTY